MEYATVSSAGMLTGRRFFLNYYDFGTVPTAKLTRNRHANHPCAYHQKITLHDSHRSSNLPSTLIQLRFTRQLTALRVDTDAELIQCIRA
jgi:hypothetical protein